MLLTEIQGQFGDACRNKNKWE